MSYHCLSLPIVLLELIATDAQVPRKQDYRKYPFQSTPLGCFLRWRRLHLHFMQQESMSLAVSMNGNNSTIDVVHHPLLSVLDGV